MTREEAIETLGHVVPFATQNGEKIAEAIDRAIEALSEDISEDGTLKVKVKDGSKVNRVLVWGENNFGGLYYPDDGNVEIVRCKDCKYKCLYDEGETKYYYCALEDRPNRNWSVDDTDYCSWGERREDGE